MALIYASLEENRHARVNKLAVSIRSIAFASGLTARSTPSSGGAQLTPDNL